jgi:hypothetical protein
MATTTTSFPASLSSEALLPVLTAQLGSELLAKQVIKTLEKAAENEARKKQQQQQEVSAAASSTSPSVDQNIISSSSASPPITFPPKCNYNNNDNINGTSLITPQNHHKSAFLPVSQTITTPSSHKILFPIAKHPSSFVSPPLPLNGISSVTSSSPSILSTSNIQNVPPKIFSRPSTPPSSRASSFRHPSPSTSACSIRSTSSTINSSSDKPFAVNIRGRKRVYTDEERRLRKNNSSKKSREKHTEQVMEKKLRLQQLQDKHQRLIEKRQQLDREIQEHRQHLCPYCLNVVEEALREIGKGQDIVVLKRVNFCCSTYHSQRERDQQQQQQSQLDEDLPQHSHRQSMSQQPSNSNIRHASSNANNTDDVIFDKIIKHEPSEFSG